MQEIKYQLYLYQSHGFHVSCAWIPSHVGICGNEVVDRLAKDALQHERVSFLVVPGFWDLFHVVEEVFLVKWQTRWREEAKGRYLYKFQLRVSLKVLFSGKDRAKQMAITRLRLVSVIKICDEIGG